MPQDEPEHTTQGSDLDKREQPQPSLVTQQANMRPGQSDDPDAEPADEPDDKAQRRAMVDEVEHEDG